jgi:dihydrodipicolinate synthase/N-acetylneuraminate lyase
MANVAKVDPDVLAILKAGAVIPAHPLALTAERKLDERHQVALTRYYTEAGARGIAAGVHTTQFAIRDVGLFEPVLRLIASSAREFEARSGRRLVKVAGVCGPTKQAIREAEFAHDAGFDLGLLSLTALKEASDSDLIRHCRMVGEVIPLFGFYLQPSVGGRPLSYEFWREFCNIEAVAAIKLAPFDRYRTLDAIRGVSDSGRSRDIALYTGNDDNIIPDLLAEFSFRERKLRFSGGLLGQWAVWTRCAVELLDDIRECREDGGRGALDILARSASLTDANAALFDVANQFSGCIAGLHEILRRQGLLAGRWCLDPKEDLSPGQLEEIDRVCQSYPELQDDEFVRNRLECWLR